MRYEVPAGQDFLCVSNDIVTDVEPTLLDLHSAEWVEKNKYEIRKDALRFETWEGNYAGKIGLGTAIDYALNLDISVTWPRICHLAEELRLRLTQLTGVTVHDLGRQKCGIVTFTVDGKKPLEIKLLLADKKINVTVAPKCYTLLDMEQRGFYDGLVRASLHYYNSEEEIDLFCRTLETII